MAQDVEKENEMEVDGLKAGALGEPQGQEIVITLESILSRLFSCSINGL